MISLGTLAAFKRVAANASPGGYAAAFAYAYSVVNVQLRHSKKADALTGTQNG